MDRLLIRNLAIAIGIIAGTLAFGTVGNHYILEESWPLSFENATLVAIGVGLVSTENLGRDVGRRMWLSIYGIVSWILFAIVIALILQLLITPVIVAS